MTTRPERIRVENTAIKYADVPAAIPDTKAKNINPMSRVSLITVLKRIIDSAPTRAKARAMLFPIIIIAVAEIIVTITSKSTKDAE